MPQRTIANARQFLSDLAPQLNPEMWARYGGEITAAEQAATARADQYLSERFNAANVAGQQAVVDLCALRDEANALVAAVRAGELDSTEANGLLNDLRAEQRRIERQAADLHRSTDHIQAVEYDPVGWVDASNEKFPNIRPNFSF